MAKRGKHPGKKAGMGRATEKLIIAALVPCCVAALFFASYMVVKSLGKTSLAEHADQVSNKGLAARLNDMGTKEEGSQELKEGQILVNGEVYEYNRDILTFLCMGVDSRSGIKEGKTPGEAGQADAILLAVVNPRRENISIIAVNRDSMTDIKLYDVQGMYLGEEEGQLTLQYAYGDGREKSCELMEQAVSDLFYSPSTAMAPWTWGPSRT